MSERSQSGAIPQATQFDDEIAPTRQRDALIGQTLGDFVIESMIGHGAMGAVYRATQPLLGKQVAIKVLHQGVDDDGKLLAEARALISARHPNIIDLISFGETSDGRKYFVMELLLGEALDLHLRANPLSLEDTVAIVKQLLSGLAAAHAANVVHGDLKPSNFFMARLADGSQFLKILDFGLAVRVDDVKTKGVQGSPAYMSPELTRGETPSPQSDLYAVGCIAFELITGKCPYDAKSLKEIFALHQRAPIPSLPERFPRELDAFVKSLLEKDPSRRPVSAASAKQTLDRIERTLIFTDEKSAADITSPRMKSVLPRGKHIAGPRPISAPKGMRPTVMVDQDEDEDLPEPQETSRSGPVPQVVDSKNAPTAVVAPLPPSARPMWIIAGVAVVIILLIVFVPNWRGAPEGSSADPIELRKRVVRLEKTFIAEHQEDALRELRELEGDFGLITPVEAQQRLDALERRWR